MENIHKTFVINLDRSKDRLEKFDSNMIRIGVPYERWPAVDGRKVKRDSKIATFFCKHFACSQGVVGCYLSHFYLWKHISTNLPDGWYLISEDDVQITKKAIRNLEEIFVDLRSWDYNNPYPEMINLHGAEVFKVRRATPRLYETPFVNGTACYILTKRTADKLYRLMKPPIPFHVDFTLFAKQILNKSVSYYTTTNYMENLGGDSTVSSKTIPTLEAAIACKIASIFLDNSSCLCAVFYSSLLSGASLSMNVFILFSVFFIALLLRYGMYGWVAFYLIIQCLHYFFA